MVENLVIVESPAKAKTIERFLGNKFLVKSSNGHIRDLSKKKLGINIENNFEPLYEISPEKKKLVADLRKLSSEAKIVWLASDEDREGEAIAWHLAEALKLDKASTRRIVFHEITKNAIEAAIQHPRSIDLNLVNAQQARRVLDRLVGFELSPLLWKKVKPALSAGRVQSVAVRLIVEREREIEGFASEPWYKVTATFETLDVNGNTVEFKADLSKRFETKEETIRLLEKCRNAKFQITEVTTKPTKKSPAPPFTTSTLQQEASRKLGFSVSQTMKIAQKLYEEGKITYMRTDSVNLSNLALGSAKKEVIKLLGEKYVKTRQFKTKTKGAQEAHEAIRPTYLEHESINGTNPEKNLYDLIWKRTIASQMADAELEKTTAVIRISTTDETFVATGEVIRFDGFLRVYLESTDDEKKESKEILPALKVNDEPTINNILAIERFTQRAARYTEASLVKKMEELGIGRPSTFAPTISTILQREYVVKEDRPGVRREYDYITLKNNKIKEEKKSEQVGVEKSKLFPTDIGSVVNDFLIEHFRDILDYNFTATVEKEFDEIAEGELLWNKMIEKFYKEFHRKVEDTTENSEITTGRRQLGTEPGTDKPVFVRIGRYGPMAQIGDSDLEKPRFAALLKNQRIETITLDEALELFKLPRNIGLFEDKDVIVGIGKFGPYIKHQNKFYSMKRGVDEPRTIELERAIVIIEQRREAEKNKVLLSFPEDDEMKILNGRYGPYLYFNKNNYKLPSKTDFNQLTVEDCRKIISEAPEPKSKKKRKT
ncbi:MAG: type I DNA topoisomerase [Bacteroidia bacterium]|nr:type I DNA topoisomerase [Bacteroidia bacterium]